MNIPDILDSNKKIIDMINSKNNFVIVRLGLGAETFMTCDYLKTGKILSTYLRRGLNLNGIYSKNRQIDKIENFCKKYNNAIKNANVLASLPDKSQSNSAFQTFLAIQSLFVNNYKLPRIDFLALEPFYICQENKIPWTKHLLGKKVLIINPFVDSFQKQIDNKFQIFKDPDKKIFHDNQEFIFYKSYQTIAGNHIHNDWVETFNIMCKDIKELDFDIALLGCGGYGLPLCDFIKTELKKSAIYIGGGIQLLFGVMGSRWEHDEMWKKIIKENNTRFIRPSKSEICPNYKIIEGGCYW